jgi:excisionase family DNA binding protein
MTNVRRADYGENRLLLRPEEVADMLALSRATIYQMLRDDELPSITVGKSRRIPVQALHDWVNERTGVTRQTIEDALA